MGKTSAKPSIQLLAEVMPLVKSLKKNLLAGAVVLLGSRAKRRRPATYADWDLGITGGKRAINSRTYLKLKALVDDLAENLPRQVDLVNLDAAPKWFFDGMDYEPIFLGGQKRIWNLKYKEIHG